MVVQDTITGSLIRVSWKPEPMLDAFERAAAEITYGRPTVPMASGVTGSMATDRDLSDPKYWRRHIRETVRFDAAQWAPTPGQYLVVYDGDVCLGGAVIESARTADDIAAGYRAEDVAV